MKKFKKPSFMIIESSDDESYCKVNIEPLERSFGITIGNALRRTLLSSTPGHSMISIKVQNANNEYSTVKGIVGDVLSMILNLKKLAIRVDKALSKENEIAGFTLEPGKKVGKIYAKDITLPAGYEIMNKDLYITTTTMPEVLNVIIYVTNGRGYYTSEETRNWVKEIGCISTDANFSPIENCNYSVQSVVSDRERDNECLEINVLTDKSITAKEGIASAAKILQVHLEEFVSWSVELPEENIILEQAEEEKREVLSTQIEDLNFTVRSYNCLKRAGIENIKELINRTEEDMMNLRNLGKKSYNEIVEKVKELDLQFKEY